MKFHENPFSESRYAPRGRTDRHGKANNRNFETRSKIRYQTSKPPVFSPFRYLNTRNILTEFH